MQSKCFLCKGEDSIYKCKDCSHGALLKCKACLVSVHVSDPLHQIKVRHILSAVIVSHNLLALEQKFFRQSIPSRARIVSSTGPFGGEVSMPGKRLSSLYGSWSVWCAPHQYRLLWLPRYFPVEGGANPSPWMVSCHVRSTSNGIHLQVSKFLPWTHASRQGQHVWFLPYYHESIRQCGSFKNSSELFSWN